MADIIIFLLFAMLFCHIVDDYYLQGFLASAKQKDYWKKNYPDELYKYDYIIALIEHGFSWTFMIHLPVVIVFLTYGVTLHRVFISFFINWMIHTIIDHLKANMKKINLIEDQCVHIIQIIITWVIVVLFSMI